MKHTLDLIYPLYKCIFENPNTKNFLFKTHSYAKICIFEILYTKNAFSRPPYAKNGIFEAPIQKKSRFIPPQLQIEYPLFFFIYFFIEFLAFWHERAWISIVKVIIKFKKMIGYFAYGTVIENLPFFFLKNVGFLIKRLNLKQPSRTQNNRFLKNS